MCKPAKSDKKCNLNQLPDFENPSDSKNMISLFEMKQMQGWWPLVNEDTKNRQLTVIPFNIYLSIFSFDVCTRRYNDILIKSRHALLIIREK